MELCFGQIMVTMCMYLKKTDPDKDFEQSKHVDLCHCNY